MALAVRSLSRAATLGISRHLLPRHRSLVVIARCIFQLPSGCRCRMRKSFPLYVPRRHACGGHAPPRRPPTGRRRSPMCSLRSGRASHAARRTVAVPPNHSANASDGYTGIGSAAQLGHRPKEGPSAFTTMFPAGVVVTTSNRKARSMSGSARMASPLRRRLMLRPHQSERLHKRETVSTSRLREKPIRPRLERQRNVATAATASPPIGAGRARIMAALLRGSDAGRQ